MFFFHPEGGDALERVAQGGCGCPIPGGIQGQAGCGSGQPGLLVDDSAHSRGVETQRSLWSFSTLAILRFCDEAQITSSRLRHSTEAYQEGTKLEGLACLTGTGYVGQQAPPQAAGV